MMITLNMGPDFSRTVEELSSMGAAVLSAVSRGLDTGGKLAAGAVQRDYLSGQSLKRRTGTLAREVDSWMPGKLEAIVGVPADSPAAHYAWLLSDEQKTILPTKGKYLTIPIGEGLTPSGVPRYSSPREVTDGFFIKSKKGQLLFGIKHGKRGRFRPLFVLVKSVFVQGTGALLDGVNDSIDKITGSIEDNIKKVKGINR